MGRWVIISPKSLGYVIMLWPVDQNMFSWNCVHSIGHYHRKVSVLCGKQYMFTGLRLFYPIGIASFLLPVFNPVLQCSLIRLMYSGIRTQAKHFIEISPGHCIKWPHPSPDMKKWNLKSLSSMRPQWLATIRQATHLSLRRRWEVSSPTKTRMLGLADCCKPLWMRPPIHLTRI